MSYVLDASAVLVLLNQEPGHVFVKEHLSQSMISAVNFSEVITVLVGYGMPHIDATSVIFALKLEIIPFDTEQASKSAALRLATKPFGLSLGDRACLSLAEIKKLPVITADKIWARLELPIDILLAR